MAATTLAPDSAVSSTTVQVRSVSPSGAIFQTPGGAGGAVKQQYLIVNQAPGIHTSGGGIQIVTTGSAKQEREEAVKRREILARQPSYCKILSDLQEAESSGSEDSDRSPGPQLVMKGEQAEVLDTGHAQTTQTVMINGQQYQIVSPASDLHTINLNSTAPTQASGTVQYATAGQNGQTVFLPAGASAGVVTVASQGGGHVVVEEAQRKREIRLLKNREAARECRNKKKEYIKCLENRVAVLENQNKALIEELKSLKELYTGQKN